MGACGLWRGAAAIADNNQRCARAQVFAALLRGPSGMPWLQAQAAWAMHQQHHWTLLGYA
eukprot:11823246-Alexandrium_andersonii.AAC.1